MAEFVEVTPSIPWHYGNGLGRQHMLQHIRLDDVLQIERAFPVVFGPAVFLKLKEARNIWRVKGLAGRYVPFQKVRTFHGILLNNVVH
jgi:hypothetical protein